MEVVKESYEASIYGKNFDFNQDMTSHEYEKFIGVKIGKELAEYFNYQTVLNKLLVLS